MCSYANKVGPFSNPSETYQYYDLPFCRPEGGLEHKPETLGEVRARSCTARVTLISQTTVEPSCAAVQLLD